MDEEVRKKMFMEETYKRGKEEAEEYAKRFDDSQRSKEVLSEKLTRQ